MPGKSGKEAFSWGKRGRLGWLRRKLLQETEMEAKKISQKTHADFEMDTFDSLL